MLIDRRLTEGRFSSQDLPYIVSAYPLMPLFEDAEQFGRWLDQLADTPIRLPFPAIWIEYRDVVDIGVWCTESQRDDPRLQHNDALSALSASWFDDEGVERVLVASMDLDVPHGRAPAIFGMMGEDREGIPVPRASGKPFTFMFPADDPKRAAAIQEHAQRIMTRVQFVLSLFHVHGIVIEKHEPDQGSLRARERRKRPAPVSYHTITLPGGVSRRPSSTGRGSEAEIAAHIVRGHFARYTPENPLFGRLVGTFWRPMHMRGNPEHGTVIKDYEARDPKAGDQNLADPDERD